MNEQRVPALTFSDVAVGTGIWLVTSMLVIGAGIFGNAAVKPAVEPIPDLISSFCHWDGLWYIGIVGDGYKYPSGEASSTVFFPAYPCFARTLGSQFGLSPQWSLLATSQLFMLLSLVALHAYLRRRYPNLPPHGATFGTTVFAVFPPTFFFRMAYSESLFFFLVTLTLLAVERRRSLVWIAFVVGLATAARPVGIALVAIVVCETFRRSDFRVRGALRLVVLLPISIWGLLAYMAFLEGNFNEPLAFAKSQRYWNLDIDQPFTDKLPSILTFEPIWGAFGVETTRQTAVGVYVGGRCIPISALNGFVYLSGIALVVVGRFRGWLGNGEFFAAIGLFAIPYVTRGYDSVLLSFARFTSVVVMIYPPLTIILLKSPYFLRIAYLLLCTALLFLFSALFAANYLLL